MRGSLLLGVAGLVLLTACDGVFTPDRPPSELDWNSIADPTVVGEAVDVAITVRDKNGNALEGEPVVWAADAGAVDPASSVTDSDGVARTRWTLGTTAGPQVVRAQAGELEDELEVSVEAGALVELTVEPGDQRLESIGDSVQLQATGRDTYGNAPALQNVAWASSAPSVVEVTSTGLAISRAEGEAQIAASVGDVSETVRVLVDQILTGLAVELWTTVLVPTERFTLDARSVDARGSTVDTTLALTWGSSDPGVVTVNANGEIEAVGVGTATITASAALLSGQLDVSVRAGPRPSVTSVSPAVLAPGEPATITGVGFSPNVGSNRVTVAGALAEVQQASATELTVAVPSLGALPCGPVAPLDVMVAVDELEAYVFPHPVSGAPQVDLAVGEAATFDQATIGCNELPAGGRYLVTVFNTSRSASALTGFELQGAWGAGGAAAPFARLDPQSVRSAAPAPAGAPVTPEVRDHLTTLERNMELLRRMGAPTAPAVSPSALKLQATPARVGDVRTFRIPDLDGNSLCDDFETVTARAVYVGDRGVIYEDTVAPLAGTMDDRWEDMGVEFDEVMYPVLLEYFGDPLTYDGRLDGDGRFNMLFSPTVNGMETQVKGFVASTDFYPRASCGSSNAGEIFYGRVPTVAGAGYDENTAEAWYWDMRSTVIHEVKHITSFAHKLRDAVGGAANWEDQWLEESTARLAEEYYARDLFGYGQRDNVGYQESIYGEVRVGDNWPEYDPYPAIMISHFGGLSQYLAETETRTPIGKKNPTDYSFYGSGWLFVRWAIDQSGRDEATFVRELVDEDDVAGIANIEERTGRTFRELLGDFSLAVATDDYSEGFTPTAAAHSHPSWNTRDIYAGLHEDFPSSYTVDWPLTTHELSGGNFTFPVDELRGGSTSVFELTVPNGQRQLLRVKGASSDTPPIQLGMAILRVQ